MNWTEILQTIIYPALAVDRLKDLRGFAPSDIGKWVEAQTEIALGKLLGWVLSGAEPETSDLANTPASEE